MKILQNLIIICITFLLISTCSLNEKKRKVTISYLARATVDQLPIWQKVIDQFMKENPDINVQIENVSYNEYWSKLLTMSAAGEVPDIIFMESTRLPSFVEKNALLSFNELIKDDKDINLNEFYPVSVEMSKYKDQLFGLPNDLAIIAMYYNKDLFDQAGIPYPKAGWTWNDLINIGKKLTIDKEGNGVPQQYGLTHYDWEIAVYQNNGNLVDNVAHPTKSTFNTPRVIEALNFVNDLYTKYKICPTPGQQVQNLDVNEMFFQGRAAMIIAGHWMVPKFRKITAFKWDVVVLPKGKKMAGLAYGSCFSIPKASKHPQEAYRLIKYLTGIKGQEILVADGFSVPALKSIANSKTYLTTPPDNQKAFLDMIEYGHLKPQSPNYIEMEHAWGEQLDSIWFKHTPVLKVVKNVDYEVNKIFKQIK